MKTKYGIYSNIKAFKGKRRSIFDNWAGKRLKDGSVVIKEDGKWIRLHRSMGLYWIDYGRRGGSIMATMVPAKTLTEAMELVEDAKKNLRTGRKR